MNDRARRTVFVCARPELGRLAASTARQIGFQVEEASLEQVLDRVSEEVVAVIVESEQLTRLTGHALFASLRSYDIPLIVLQTQEGCVSSTVSHSDQQVYVLDRPIRWNELTDTLQRFGRRPADPRAARSDAADASIRAAVDMLRQAVVHCGKLVTTMRAHPAEGNGRAVQTSRKTPDRKHCNKAGTERFETLRRSLRPDGGDINYELLRLQPLLTRQMSGEGQVVFDLSPSRMPIRAAEDRIAELILRLASWARDVLPAGYQWTFATRQATLRELPDLPVPVLGKGCYVMLRLTGESAASAFDLPHQSSNEYHLTVLSPANTLSVARMVTECGGYLHVEYTHNKRLEIIVLFEHGGDGL